MSSRLYVCVCACVCVCVCVCVLLMLLIPESSSEPHSALVLDTHPLMPHLKYSPLQEKVFRTLLYIIITNMSAADPVNQQLLFMNTAGPGQNNPAFMKLTFSQDFV